MSDNTGRRKFIQLGLGAVGLGIVGSLSGCSAIQDSASGSGEQTDTTDGTPTDGDQGYQLGAVAGFSDWVYEPDEFDADAGGLTVDVIGYSAVVSNRERLRDDTYQDIIGDEWSQLGVGPEDVDIEIQLPDGKVITGSLETDAVKEQLQTASSDSDIDTFESERTYDDTYEIFAPTPQTHPRVAYAVEDQTIV